MEARRLYGLAAAQGDAQAQYSLGGMHFLGECGPVNCVEARRWYGLAAAQSDADGQYNFGQMHVTGKGGPVDYVEARRWYGLAAAQGQADAQCSLAFMHSQGKGGPVNYHASKRQFAFAAAQGHTAARMWYILTVEAIADDVSCENEECDYATVIAADALLLEEKKEREAALRKAAKKKEKKVRKKQKERKNTRGADGAGGRGGLDEACQAEPMPTIGEEDAVDTIAGLMSQSLSLPPSSDIVSLADSGFSIELKAAVAESTLGGDTTCIVCFTNPKTHLSFPCGHQCVCETCSVQMSACPICRCQTTSWVKVHLA